MNWAVEEKEDFEKESKKYQNKGYVDRTVHGTLLENLLVSVSSENKSTWSLWWKWCKTLLNHLTSLRHDDVIRTIEWRHGSFLIRGNLQIGNMNVSHVNGFEKYGSLIDMNGPWWRHRRWWRHRINQEEVELGRSDFPGGWHSRSSPWPAWTKPHLEFNVPAPQSQKNLNFGEHMILNQWFYLSYRRNWILWLAWHFLTQLAQIAVSSCKFYQWEPPIIPKWRTPCNPN